MAKSTLSSFSYRSHQIPIRIFLEWRNTVRISFGKETVLLRIPRHMRRDHREREIKKAKLWAIKQLDKHPELCRQYIGTSYQDGDMIKVRNKTFRISIDEERRKTSKAEILDGQLIQITLATGLTPREKAKTKRALMSRSLASYFLPQIRARVLELNKQYFNEKINGVYLKYNSSNWGSCSSNQNINLSTRLLFAPEAVMDYVIIHELSHLKEMNHSPKFWSWVRKADPDYRSKIAWINENGAQCDFK